jgi:hypothetical protein
VRESTFEADQGKARRHAVAAAQPGCVSEVDIPDLRR